MSTSGSIGTTYLWPGRRSWGAWCTASASWTLPARRHSASPTFLFLNHPLSFPPSGWRRSQACSRSTERPSSYYFTLDARTQVNLSQENSRCSKETGKWSLRTHLLLFHSGTLSASVQLVLIYMFWHAILFIASLISKQSLNAPLVHITFLLSLPENVT